MKFSLRKVLGSLALCALLVTPFTMASAQGHGGKKGKSGKRAPRKGGSKGGKGTNR